MSQFFEDSQSHLWWIDVDEIAIMLRMWAQEKSHITALSIHPSNDEGMQELRFNQAKFRRHRERFHQEEMGRVSQNIYNSPESVVNQLINRYQEIPRLEEQKRRYFRRVQHHNNEEVDRRVAWGERGLASAQITRDLSTAIFMCCIPVSGLGLSAAMLAQLSGSTFQGISTYQDTGNAGAAIATGVFSFKSSLMVLPATAGRVAQIVFAIVNTGNRAVANSAITMMTLPPESSRTFTDVLRQDLLTSGINEALNTATGPVLEQINDRLSGAVLPIFTSVARDIGNSALTTQITSSLQTRDPQQASPGGRTRVQPGRSAQTVGSRDALWESTPFYQFYLTGDPHVLLSQTQLYIRGRMLRRGE